MAYVTAEGLRWALRTLREWKSELANSRIETLTTGFLLLKFVGVKSTSTTPLSSGDLEEAADRFLKVSYSSDGTVTRTGGAERYWHPLALGYVAVTRPGKTTKYIAGTLRTQLERQYKDQLLVFGDGNPPVVQFADGYLDFLSNRTSRIPIPAPALATFLFRRPSDCMLQGLPDIDTLGGLTDKFFQEFNITDAERVLFSTSLPQLDFAVIA